MPQCLHEDFRTNVSILRLSREDGGPVESFRFEAQVKCAQCGVKFRFVGMQAGLSYAEPMVSTDATELRAPIEAAYVEEILGVPAVSGRA